MAETICWRIALDGRFAVAIITMFSRRMSGIARIVGVDGRHRACMARVHRLQHVKCFGAATLTDNDPVGTHTQSVLHEITLRDLSGSFDIGRSRLEADDMRLLQRNSAASSIVITRSPWPILRDKRVEKRRFARARAAGNKNVHPAGRSDLQARAPSSARGFDCSPSIPR